MKLLTEFISVLLIGYAVHSATSFKTERGVYRFTIELLIVADYSEFNKWYQLTSASLSHSQRVNEATEKVKQYAAALIHSSNNVYRSLELHSIYIDIKLVDVLVMTTPSSSPWTETVKVPAGSSYDVDPTRVLPIFQPKSVDLQKTIPHDHAMILTKYPLFHGGGSTFSGYAYTDAECKAKSVSIVQDNEDFYTAQLIAHEIGHSLGCQHDGDGNSCPTGAGYAMEAGFILANKKKWFFSDCSLTSIWGYLMNLNRNHTNCMKVIDNNHPDTHVATATHEWYGQVYTWDEQCQIHYGPTSYLCRDQYHGSYDNVCLKMFCYDPKKRACYYLDGGDGSPCGTGKWCMSDVCVTNSASQLKNIDDACVAGDQPGVVYNGRTCQQIGTSHHSDCSHSSVKRKCCYSCSTSHHGVTSHPVTSGHVTSAPVTSAPGTTSGTDIDRQCAAKHGTGSFMCRGAKSYSGKTYQDTVCWDLQCHDPNRDNWCLSSKADDRTSCGNQKWCQNGICVHNSAAPAVPDNCPWGNQKGVAIYGMTCDEFKQPENHWRCYDDFIAKICCDACNSVKRNVRGCEYGDKSDWCQSNIAHSADRRNCYYGHNTDLCCESCNKFKNAAHVGCEYGDRQDACLSYRCHTYSADTTQKCCETCSPVTLIG